MIKDMRSYGQHCGLAKALDVIGDRWTLLIVRELLIRGASRYTDLRNGLPGIATNLLAERLNEMEEAGVVCREEARPPIATTLFHLTKRGKELEEAVFAIGRWGAPLLANSGKRDAIRSHWLVLPLKIHLRDHAPKQPAFALELRTDDEPITLETAVNGLVNVRLGPSNQPDGTLSGPPKTILAFLTGKLTFKDARAEGMRYEGDARTLRRVQTLD